MKTNLRLQGNIFILLLLLLYSSCTRQERIPITTSSDEAKDLFDQAFDAMKKVYMEKAYDLLDQALAKDTGFFLAAYYRAMNAFYLEDPDDFQIYGNKALNSTARLSKGEKIMKEALRQLLENNQADVTELGKKLVTAYPSDEIAYYQLAMYQQLIKDEKGAIQTYRKALEVTDDPAPVYNMLGYTYMSLDSMDQAKLSFDKYIELAPEQPNPYDSKGDYYMKLGEYEHAYENYMKAFEIDADFHISYTKAMKVRSEMDTLVMD